MGMMPLVLMDLMTLPAALTGPVVTMPALTLVFVLMVSLLYIGTTGTRPWGLTDLSSLLALFMGARGMSPALTLVLVFMAASCCVFCFRPFPSRPLMFEGIAWAMPRL